MPLHIRESETILLSVSIITSLTLMSESAILNSSACESRASESGCIYISLTSHTSSYYPNTIPECEVQKNPLILQIKSEKGKDVYMCIKMRVSMH